MIFCMNHSVLTKVTRTSEKNVVEPNMSPPELGSDGWHSQTHIDKGHNGGGHVKNDPSTTYLPNAGIVDRHNEWLCRV